MSGPASAGARRSPANRHNSTVQCVHAPASAILEWPSEVQYVTVEFCIGAARLVFRGPCDRRFRSFLPVCVPSGLVLSFLSCARAADR